LKMDDKLIYKGQSMQGTFSFGDRLIIEHVRLASVRPGDVVVYRVLNHKGSQDMLVHRVMGVAPSGLVVRGDNNSCDDQTIVTQNNLVGKVSHVERGRKRSLVCGASSGLMMARAYHGWSFLRHEMWKIIRLTGRWSYRRLRGSGLIRRLWKPSILKIQLMTANGPLIKYVCRNRTVGLLWPENDRVTYRKPYDLVMGRQIPKESKPRRAFQKSLDDK
jgi:signal peptidase I